MSAESSKRALRAQIRGRRRRAPVDPKVGRRFAEQVLEVLPAGPVALYLSRAEEPPTEPLVAALADRTLLAPRVEGAELLWCPVQGAELAVSALHIAEPLGAPLPEGLRSCAAVVMPALAVDAAGRRLGQGGGFFDRSLAGVPRFRDGGPLRIALVFDAEVLDAVPVDPHDAPVDVVVTDRRILRC